MTEPKKIIEEKFNIQGYVVSRKEHPQNSPDGVTIETTYRQKRMTDPSIQELKNEPPRRKQRGIKLVPQ